MPMLYRSDKQKCINLNHTNNNNNSYKSHVYYKLLYADPNPQPNAEPNADGVQCNVKNDDALDNEKEKEDNVYLFMPYEGQKKHLIVYYKPPKKLQLNSTTYATSTSDQVFNNTTYYLQHFAQNLMYLCFCRSFHHRQHRRQNQQHYDHHLHHYTPRRLGTF